MEKMGLNEIREKYLSFFEGKGHLRMKSASLIPENDPSLLLIGAGMAPFKQYFTGAKTPPKKRVTTCQKCIRTPDIDNVGKTARHGTFFEMLGNFSFGDYFKKEACAWAWEFVTQVMNIPPERLWISIYLEDDEAFDIWTKEVGIEETKIVRMGKEDNFWEIGTGPCGPCSEIYFDRGEKYGCGGEDCKVGCDCDRYVEFWNLVFTQFDKDDNGNYNKLENPNIDTGMGLERMAVIMQDVSSLFEVDTIRRVLDRVCELSGREYGKEHKTDVSVRVITDHIRGTVFMVSDGVLPSNEGRGYVLRRLLRRGVRHGRLLGIREPFLSELGDFVIESSGDAYPELREKRDFIKSVIQNEESKFNETLEQGLLLLKQLIGNVKSLSGENAFKLYDTYGFPLDLTLEILAEKNISVDVDEFKRLMQNQREKARSGRNDEKNQGFDNVGLKLDKDLKTEFTGYTNDTSEGKITAILKDKESVSSASDSCIIVTDKTCLYAEGGGQCGDKGEISAEAARGRITDTKRIDDVYLHYCDITEGVINLGDVVSLSVDKDERRAIKRNHSATHLLQKALRDTLGSHVEQAGSYVTSERLRFDFTHISALTRDELMKIETDVNEAILEGMDINIFNASYDEAVKMGAMALFSEKYGDTVRVVKMGDYSTELCGGLHLSNTAQAGMFKIINETGIAAGVRRIEAVTGLNTLKIMRTQERAIGKVSSLLKSSPAELAGKAVQLMEDIRRMNKETEALKAKLASSGFDDILRGAKDINGIKVVIANVEGLDIQMLRALGDKIRDSGQNVFALLGSVKDEKPSFVAVAGKKAVDSGIHCGNIIRDVAKAAGGGGGGRPDSAQAGGKDPSKLGEAMKVAERLVSSILE